MKKTVILAMACALLASACAAPQSMEAAPTVPIVAASPALSTPEDVYVLPGVPYAASPDLMPPEDLLTKYRPFPGDLSAGALEEALAALPPIHLETPQTGAEKLYFKDCPFGAGYLAEGTVTKEGLNALVKALESAERGQQLKATLETHGLTFRRMGENLMDDFPLYDELAGTPCPYRVTSREMEKGVTLITVAPPDPYRSGICHLVFCEESGVYRFAAMCAPSVESDEYRDRVVSANGLRYFVCNCEMGWGTGVYCRYLTVCPMQEGVYGRLWYQQNGYDCPWSFCENLTMNFPEPERAENGGAHFILAGAFNYENYSDLNYEGFEDVFCGTLTVHVYDDGDGEGLYMYAGDVGPDFSFYTSERLKELFARRAALMLLSENDEVCLLAENFVWERDLSPEGYPYRSYSAQGALLGAIRDMPYAAKAGKGEKYYIGNAPQPAGNGSLSAEALAALERALSDCDTDAAEAIAAAGLTLPEGVSLPELRAADTSDPYKAAFKRLVRYEMDDALALELRAPDDEHFLFDSVILLFLRESDVYTFLTALPRWGYVYEEKEAGMASILEVSGLKYLCFPSWPQKEGEGDQFHGGVWVPFRRGSVTSKIRTVGGCTLPGVSGAPLRYWVELPFEPSAGLSFQTLDVAVHYELYYETRLWFTIPLSLYNDGDGKGFYSFDANCKYLFTDILSVPYARNQIEGQLQLQTESSDRAARTVAAALLEKISGAR